MRVFLLLLCAAFLSSCALNYVPQVGGTTFITDEPMTAVVGPDTLRMERDELNFIPLKRGEDTEMILIRNLKTDTIALPHSAYNMCIRLTDRKIEKFSLDVTRSNSFYTRRGTVLFHLAFPYLNLFHAAYGNQSRIGGGFMGLALGVDYFFKNSMFLNLSGGGIVDFMLPFPVPVCYGSGVVNRQSSVYGSLSNNHMLLRNRLSVGYGFSFSHDTWNTIDYGPTEEEKSEGLPWQDATCYRSSNALGVILRCYYYTRGSFFFGLSYRPTFIQFAGRTRCRYQSTASVEFGFRIG